MGGGGKEEIERGKKGGGERNAERCGDRYKWSMGWRRERNRDKVKGKKDEARWRNKMREMKGGKRRN